MKKPGEWIATMNAALEVSRVSVEASEMLDAIAIWVGDHGGKADHVHYFDRVEAAQLRDELGAALDRLERGAIERQLGEDLAAAGAPGAHRYEALCTSVGWMVWDHCKRRVLENHHFSGERQAREAAEWWNRLDASRADDQSQAHPPRIAADGLS